MVVERREAQRARSRRFAQADLLWRAPRPKRERVATSVRVAWPTTPAPPGAPLKNARGFSCAWLFVNLALAKLGRAGVARMEEHARHCVEARLFGIVGRRPVRTGLYSRNGHNN